LVLLTESLRLEMETNRNGSAWWSKWKIDLSDEFELYY
jgi:hypothetical protein